MANQPKEIQQIFETAQKIVALIDQDLKPGPQIAAVIRMVAILYNMEARTLVD